MVQQSPPAQAAQAVAERRQFPCLEEQSGALYRHALSV
jgi:hypothetical protein